MTEFDPKKTFEERRIVARAEFDTNFKRLGETQRTKCGKKMQETEKEIGESFSFDKITDERDFLKKLAEKLG